MANQQTHSDKFEELCAGYVLHALDEEERKEFEQMLSEASDEERTLYQEMWSAANQLAFTFEPSEPSADLKDRLMAEIRAQDDQSKAKDTDSNISSIDDTPDTDDEGFNWSAFAVAASFALIVVSLSLIFYSFNLSSTISEKEKIIASKETTITELKNELRRKDEMLSILEARDVDLVMMAGLEVNPNGYGKIIWNAEKQQALLQVSNLPAVPQDKDYQLWLIKDNKPISAGVFAVNDKKDKFFKIEEMAKATEQSANAFAVTMEPKGGVPQPTGDMYLMGNVNK
ncbi:anti-sigma factor [Fodinibius halophilus]|uniref:Regulator of SigK n=1 Tax=Fodinibius halophilus TaxID=1736908 RepID=A0A6M1TGV8_9BACT|nr:anti-sigma factor [Fodinibius halophilus]NGP89342.1 anti-sigma factor [Fodinibius halophilus]